MGKTLAIFYLHEHSQLRIVHGNLTVSNIPLDEKRNPKISNFCLPRQLGMNQTHENTLQNRGNVVNIQMYYSFTR